MKIIFRSNGQTVYKIITNRSMTLDEALDLMAPDDWREQVNKYGFYIDEGCEIYYDDLDMVY